MLCDNCGNKISCVFNASSTVEKCEMYIPKVKLLKEQPTGHWTTRRTLQHDGEWYCDRCDYEPTVFEATPYCPNCGAMMEVEE